MKSKNHLLKILKEIKKDCLKLKLRNNLTEFGKGQLHLILMIEDYLSF